MDGFLLVDKPAGIAFASVLKVVKRKFGAVRVGHGGSLDAMASGLFIVALGDANKFANGLMGADRTWEGTVDWSHTTNTGDFCGTVESPSGPGATAHPAPPANLADFKGDIFQSEPRWCAIRKEGTASYELVDTGDHAPFMTHVYRLAVEGEKIAVKATARTIIRALVRDMGGTLRSLRRLSIGRFSVNDAIPFDRLLTVESKDFQTCVIPMRDALR